MRKRTVHLNHKFTGNIRKAKGGTKKFYLEILSIGGVWIMDTPEFPTRDEAKCSANSLIEYEIKAEQLTRSDGHTDDF